MLKLIQSTSLIDEVIEQLKGLILDGALKPGERFPTEYELCAQLGVSRTAIREAKKSLIGMGLLETRRGQGTYVREDIFDGLMEKASLSLRMGAESIKELIEARRTKPIFFSLLGVKEDVETCRAFLEGHQIPFTLFPELAVRAVAHMWRYARGMSEA